MYHYGYIKLLYLPLWMNDLDAVYVKQNHLKVPYKIPEIWGPYCKCNETNV